MKKPTDPAKPRRRWLLAIGAAIALVVGIGLNSRSSEEAQPSRSSTGYQIEDGTVAWRPMSRADQVVVNVLTLGLASNAPSVRGHTMPLADASSFRGLSGGYGVDRSRVWFEGKVVDGADPLHFTVVGHGFAHDEAGIWQGAFPVLALEPGQSEQIATYSSRILSVASQTWLIADPPIALPEAPLSTPEHFCRDWFVMNDALWLGAQKLLALEGPLSVLDCDGGISSTYVDGTPREDISYNSGILVRSGASVLRLGLDAEKTELARLADQTEDLMLISDHDVDSLILLARTASGTVQAHSLNGAAMPQTLGQFDSLPGQDDVFFGRAFLLGGRYFIIRADQTDSVVIDHGPAERIADLVLADDTLFRSRWVVAHPGNLPLREIDSATLLIGAACVNFGSYVTDVADPAGDPAAIKDVCQTMRRPSEILYEGLQIRFSPLIVDLGPNAENPEMTELQLGTISIRNVTGTDRVLAAEFLQTFDLSVVGTSIAPPEDAWPAEGLILAADEAHSWTMQANTNADPTYWGWTLSIRHVGERAAVFGTEPFHILAGQFFY